LIGVISDTHGVLRPEAIEVLRGSDLIIHAGDIGKPEVIETLKSIAPVTAIRGNNDRGKWARESLETAIIEVGEVRIYVIHNAKELEIDPAAAGFRVVISGHSHRPSILRENGVLFLNPGSAGPRRFKLPVAVARIRVRGESVSPRIVELAV
jgi:putative phosphoesterase